MHLRGDLLFSQVKECGLSSLSLLIRGQRSDKNCLLRNKVGRKKRWQGSHLMTEEEEEEGSGGVVGVSMLLVLIGVHRKEFDK